MARRQRYLAVLTLSEAETVRRIIHVRRYGRKALASDTSHVSSSGLGTVVAVLLRQKASMALRTIQGHVVDCTDDFEPETRRDGASERPAVRSVEAGLQCLRFFNNDMCVRVRVCVCVRRASYYIVYLRCWLRLTSPSTGAA